MTLDTREAALEILLRCEKKNTTLDRTLDAVYPGLAHLSQADRNLCHAIVFGVLRHRNFLDFIIKSFSKTPVERMDQPVLTALRMALFQMRFLDRIPDFAAIDTSVELIKIRNGKKTAGFVNGVLRNAARRLNTLVLPDANNALLEHISIVHSIPLWLAKRWLTRYGAGQVTDLCRTINQIPPLTLRTNTLKTSRQDLSNLLVSAGLQVQSTLVSPDGMIVTESSIRIEAINGFDQGLFSVQDEAAQLVSLILDPRPNETILDACAGLGGKTLHLAQLMGDKGDITALDTDPDKLSYLSAEALRLGISSIQCRSMDLMKTSITDFPGFFDRVLVDAPCTGLGVLRRNPDAKWKRSLKDISRMAARQKKLLNAAANLVKPGGILVYAVCSGEKEENEQVVADF
ncbi:MAG: 16S rRNA (cytosine(967)-C(5))-methyltransferase RsmB, partial [Desulfotignum sp.]|nr:16S rRNA (cytosine(967)-C(5))-methyltransferase RsmB [Desulfotignum sp.]